MVLGPASDSVCTSRMGEPKTFRESETRSAAAFCNAIGSSARVRIVLFEVIVVWA